MSTHQLYKLAHLVQGELVGDGDFKVGRLSSLESATEHDVSFVNGIKYIEQANRSKAGVLIITPELKDQMIHCKHFILVANPYLAFAMLTHFFEVKKNQIGIESTAQIHPSADISETAYIGHYVVVGEDCKVGDHTRLDSHVVLDDGVIIGRECLIESQVTIKARTKIGNQVRIHSNTAIGGEGFGFAPYQGKWNRIAQLGSVKIGDRVRIGSNCSIDRGALDDTIIHDGVIIDNLVQIAHNVIIGENTAIAANTGIAGSTEIGKNCILAGACGVSGHIKIADNVVLTGMSMVTKSISKAGTYSSGTGLFENNSWKKAVIRIRQLADVPLTNITKRLDHIQTQIESIESTLKMRK